MASAAQKAAVAKFKLAVAYKKKHPGLTQKQAFAHVYGKKKVAGTAKKKTVKKTVGRSAPVKKRVPSSPLKRQGAPARKRATVKTIKKQIVKKMSVSTPRTPASSAMAELNRQLALKRSYEQNVTRCSAYKKTTKDTRAKALHAKEIAAYKDLIRGVSQQITTLKRAIK